MELTLVRKYCRPGYIIGKLYVNDNYLCDTLEPKNGHLYSSMSVKKIASIKSSLGIIAIPLGRYPVLITKSVKFKRWLPQLVGVPGFSGIRIHSGNTPEDTEGCILVGWNKVPGKVVNSRSALDKLMTLLVAAYNKGEAVWIRVKA